MKKLKDFVQKNLMLILGYIGLFLVSTGLSLAVFTFLVDSTPSVGGNADNPRARIDLSKPRTEECPINGGMFTKEEEKTWSTRRPIAAMIENHADSRPPSGLSYADVVYEAVAEGGITRFLGIFYCNVIAEEVNIAPVRSARIYFVNYAAEYGKNPIFMHVGGANNYSGSGDTVKEVQALEYLEKLGWRVPKGNDFDTTYDSGFPVFWRNYERLGHEVATEHTMMASIDAAYEQAAKRGFEAKDDGVAWDKNFVSWKFADEKPATATASDISFKFWDNKPDYDVSWKYNSENNSYLRFNAGKEHVDLQNNQQISTKNLVILFAKEKGPVDRNHHMFYTTIGEGDAFIFQNGQVIEGTWEKASATERTVFKDNKGKEISFVRGPIWIEVLPVGNKVNY